MSRFMFVISMLVILSCTKSELVSNVDPISPMERIFPKVDEQLWPFFIAFEDEAIERGLKIDLRSLDVNGFITNITEQGVAGYCEYGSHIENEITIDSEFWNRANYRSKEFVVFHELGHCVLMRGHDEAQTSSGICLSIMRSGVGSCRDNYNMQTRSGYIDELFRNSNN